MNLLQKMLCNAGVPADVGRIGREREQRRKAVIVAMTHRNVARGEFTEFERRGPAFDDSHRSGEAHPDYGGPQ